MRNLSLLFALFGLALTAQAQQLNEIRTDQPGGDTDEYFEITGTPGASLDGISLVVIGDGSGGQGVIDGSGGVVDLSGNTIPADGIFLVYDGTDGTLGATPDLVTALGFENGQSTTFVLARGVTATEGDDLDTDDDGTLDVTPWTEVLDAVSVVDDSPDDIAYAASLGGTELGPVGAFPPGHIYRFSDTGTWAIGEFDPTSPDATDTPGAANPAEGTATAPEIDVTPLALDFGTVDVGSTADLDVSIANTGDADLALTGLSISGSDVFSLVGAAPTSVAAGETETVTVRFAPAAAGVANAVLTIASDDADEGTVEVTLEGTGQAVAAPEPEIAVSATSVDFGDVTTGTSERRAVTISNEGDAELTLGYGITGAGFSIVGGPSALAAGASGTATLEFSPAASGAATGTFTITSNDADEGTIEVSLTGNGTDAPPPACTYAFRAISTGSTTFPSLGGQIRLKFEIDNTGSETAAQVDVWGTATREGDPDFFFVTRPPRTPTVAGRSRYRAGFFQRVPGSIEDGTYTYTLFAGDFDSSDPSSSLVCGSESFTIVKGSASTARSADATQWVNAKVEPLAEDVPQSEPAVRAGEVRVGPNPMRGQATFAFALEAAAPVRLAVYDTRGREVAVVAEGQMSEGPHAATLREDLPAGVYVWRLTAGETVQTGRLTVVR